MPFKTLCVVFAVLLCSACGGGNSTVYRASFYLPSETLTLAEQNRHDLLASTQLESGIFYQIPADTPESEADEDSTDEAEQESLPDDTAEPLKKK
jgi:hypothetical protein